MRLLLVGAVLFFASRDANAACVISGARPTVPLPTMEIGQEFSFIASPDCETLRFTIRGTTVSEIPKSGGPVGPGPHTYKVVLTESEWNAVVAESGSTLTWIVIGRTSAGVTTRMVTTNDLKRQTIRFDLSGADAKFVGEEAYNITGDTISGAGDVNADGHDDLLVGAHGNAFSAGAAYLVLGPVSGTLDLSLATAKLVGERNEDYAGGSVSGAGDVDGDGHDDVLVGAPNYHPLNYFGATYLVLGPVTGTLDLRRADATIVGEEVYDYAGTSVSDAGDVDGDGHDDVLFSAYGAHGGAGAAYVFLGPVTGRRDLSMADAELVGEDVEDAAGNSVSSAGDVDGDGQPDLLVGAMHAREDAGAAYLVKGPVTGTLSLSAADATLVGEAEDEYAGVSVSGAGDVDGDGHDDLLIGAIGHDGSDSGEYGAGAAFLVLGSVTGTLDLSLADATFVGEEPGDGAGTNVSGGDVDGDGHHDVLVAAPWHGAEWNGAGYLVLGPVTGTLDLSLADAKFVGEEAGDVAGFVSGAGDVDGDGRDDVLVGAPYNQEGGEYAGAAYLIYGASLF